MRKIVGIAVTPETIDFSGCLYALTDDDKIFYKRNDYENWYEVDLSRFPFETAPTSELAIQVASPGDKK